MRVHCAPGYNWRVREWTGETQLHPQVCAKEAWSYDDRNSVGAGDRSIIAEATTRRTGQKVGGETYIPYWSRF